MSVLAAELLVAVAGGLAVVVWSGNEFWQEFRKMCEESGIVFEEAPLGEGFSSPGTGSSHFKAEAQSPPSRGDVDPVVKHRVIEHHDDHTMRPPECKETARRSTRNHENTATMPIQVT